METKNIVATLPIRKRDFYKAVFEESLDHKMKLPYEDVLEYVEAIGDYNEFNSYDVKKMLSIIDEIIPKAYYNKDNPNNGKRDYDIYIGREGSPVMYIEIMGYGYTKTFDDTLLVIDRILEIAEHTGKADEHDYEVEENPGYNMKKLTIRLWWD